MVKRTRSELIEWMRFFSRTDVDESDEFSGSADHAPRIIHVRNFSLLVCIQAGMHQWKMVER